MKAKTAQYIIDSSPPEFKDLFDKAKESDISFSLESTRLAQSFVHKLHKFRMAHKILSLPEWISMYDITIQRKDNTITFHNQKAEFNSILAQVGITPRDQQDDYTKIFDKLETADTPKTSKTSAYDDFFKHVEKEG